MVKVEGMHPLPCSARSNQKQSCPDGPGGWPGPFCFPRPLHIRILPCFAVQRRAL